MMSEKRSCRSSGKYLKSSKIKKCTKFSAPNTEKLAADGKKLEEQ
jgi:hypothetical protein